MGVPFFLVLTIKPLVRLPGMKRQTTINIVVCRWFSVSLVFIPGPSGLTAILPGSPSGMFVRTRSPSYQSPRPLRF
jgi:hypothetical protein